MLSVNNEKYTLINRLGNGSFGNVFSVNRESDNKVFAAKCFISESFQQEIDLGALREISVLSKLQGNSEQGIMDLIDVIIDGNNIAVIMPKYSMTLTTAIHNKLLTNIQRKIITKLLCKSLVVLKGKGILHRDLKPDNILLDNKFYPVVADFTLSKVFSGISKGGTHTGQIATATYRAPEVVEQKPYGFPSDAWSLGVILYELYTGKLLTLSTDQDALTFLSENTKHLKTNAISEVIQGLLEPDPCKRWTPSQVLNSRLFNKDGTSCIQTPRILSFTPKKLPKVTDQKIIDLCQTYEVKKRVTCLAAQLYINTTNCSPLSAVLLACKFYETDLKSFSSIDQYPKDEKYILSGMKYNLFYN
jgi:serine/threonine protein kinase